MSELRDDESELSGEMALQPKWGDSLDDLDNGRKLELARRLWAWKPSPDTEDHLGPFAGERLNGLEVFWLAVCALAGPDGDTAIATEKVNDSRTSVFVPDLHLEGAILGGARLDGAVLNLAHLEGAGLVYAHLKKARLFGVHLQGAVCTRASFEGAILDEARLQWANLSGTNLEGASLDDVRLEGAFLGIANLKGANLARASFDKTTRLNGAVLTDVVLDQVTLDNTNLTVVDWDLVPVLGDELRAQHMGTEKRPNPNTSKSVSESTNERAQAYEAAARAYRLLAVALQAKGLGEIAARYAYRAQIMQRKRWRHMRRWGAYLFSGFLALFAGYGYNLRRVFGAYVITVTLFAALFLASGVVKAGGAVPSWQNVADAAQISLNAIHGRVFFANFTLDTVQSWIATGESIVGIVIEGVFVAVLIQRLFGR